MLQNIVIDLDNTISDEFGSTLRPGMDDFLLSLKRMNCNLILWTNSTKIRAREILREHQLLHFFDTIIYREDYDPGNIGVPKDIRNVSGDLLIDDDPAEIEFTRKIGRKGFLVKPYRKHSQIDPDEYENIMKMIKAKRFSRFFRL